MLEYIGYAVVGVFALALIYRLFFGRKKSSTKEEDKNNVNR